MHAPTLDAALIIKIISFFIPFLFALCFHEFAHGWVARRLGDNTAHVMGRLTLDPMAHIDWLGTVALPIMAIVFGTPMFGWAKPVPVNSRNLKHPRQDMFWIALAGPMSNIFLYVVGLAIYLLIKKQNFFVPTPQLWGVIGIFLQLNLILAFFNLIPMHPLDGGKIIARFLPLKWDMWLEARQYQMQMILMLLVIFGAFQILALPVNWIFNETVGFVDTL